MIAVTRVRTIEVQIEALFISIGLHQGYALGTYLFAIVTD